MPQQTLERHGWPVPHEHDTAPVLRALPAPPAREPRVRGAGALVLLTMASLASGIAAAVVLALLVS